MDESELVVADKQIVETVSDESVRPHRANTDGGGEITSALDILQMWDPQMIVEGTQVSGVFTPSATLPTSVQVKAYSVVPWFAQNVVSGTSGTGEFRNIIQIVHNAFTLVRGSRSFRPEFNAEAVLYNAGTGGGGTSPVLNPPEVVHVSVGVQDRTVLEVAVGKMDVAFTHGTMDAASPDWQSDLSVHAFGMRMQHAVRGSRLRVNGTASTNLTGADEPHDLVTRIPYDCLDTYKYNVLMTALPEAVIVDTQQSALEVWAMWKSAAWRATAATSTTLNLVVGDLRVWASCCDDWRPCGYRPPGLYVSIANWNSYQSLVHAGQYSNPLPGLKRGADVQTIRNRNAGPVAFPKVRNSRKSRGDNSSDVVIVD